MRPDQTLSCDLFSFFLIFIFLRDSFWAEATACYQSLPERVQQHGRPVQKLRPGHHHQLPRQTLYFEVRIWEVIDRF